jgi:hypothetical protein
MSHSLRLIGLASWLMVIGTTAGYAQCSISAAPSSGSICAGNSIMLSTGISAGEASGKAPSAKSTADAGGPTYRWSTGATTSSIVVAPGTTTVYSVTVTEPTPPPPPMPCGGSCPPDQTCIGNSCVPIAPPPPPMPCVGCLPEECEAGICFGNTEPANGQNQKTSNSSSTCSFTVTVNPLPTVTLDFPTSASINPNGPVVTVPLNQGLFFRVYGGGANVQYQRKITMDVVEGNGIFAVDNNATGQFPLNLPGPFNITVTDGNGCSRTVSGQIVGR